MARLLEALKTKQLTADGAMGTLLYSYGLEYCLEEMNVVKPELIVKNSQRIYCSWCRYYSNEHIWCKCD